jgi:hypothetical protein
MRINKGSIYFSFNQIIMYIIIINMIIKVMAARVMVLVAGARIMRKKRVKINPAPDSRTCKGERTRRGIMTASPFMIPS